VDIKKCNTLKEARDQIDIIDDKIVELIAARNAYIKQIAHFKNSVDEVKAKDRIEDVISRMRSRAIDLDLSPNLINDLYIRMIDAMVDTEIAEYHNAKNY
jgi:isochorismate pyruvate lyase